MRSIVRQCECGATLRASFEGDSHTIKCDCGATTEIKIGAKPKPKKKAAKKKAATTED